MGYFKDETKPTFRAVIFNNMIFARGKGLFLHLEKYYPKSLPQVLAKSRSKVEWTLENFSKASHGCKTHFKGIKLNYVDIDKMHRDEIKMFSEVGEGWWPGRKIQPLEDLTQAKNDFIWNYEGTGYIRRLGRGQNIPNEERHLYQQGVDFTPQGWRKMQDKYFELFGEPITNLPPVLFFQGWCHLKPRSGLAGMLVPIPSEFLKYRLKGARQEKYEELLEEYKNYYERE